MNRHTKATIHELVFGKDFVIEKDDDPEEQYSIYVKDSNKYLATVYVYENAWRIVINRKDFQSVDISCKSFLESIEFVAAVFAPFIGDDDDRA